MGRKYRGGGRLIVTIGEEMGERLSHQCENFSIPACVAVRDALECWLEHYEFFEDVEADGGGDLGE